MSQVVTESGGGGLGPYYVPIKRELRLFAMEVLKTFKACEFVNPTAKKAWHHKYNHIRCLEQADVTIKRASV